MAVIAHGVARATVDVDATVRPGWPVVAEFAAVLEDEDRPAILDRLLRQAGLR